jgi:hypothetical protein
MVEGDLRPIHYLPLREMWKPTRQELRQASRTPLTFVIVMLSGHQTPFYIPSEFLAASGDHTLGFVQHLMSLLVNEPGILLSNPGTGPGSNTLDLKSCPEAALYYFEPVGESAAWFNDALHVD